MNTDTKPVATTGKPSSCPGCRKGETLTTDAPGVAHCILCQTVVSW